MGLIKKQQQKENKSTITLQRREIVESLQPDDIPAKTIDNSHEEQSITYDEQKPVEAESPLIQSTPVKAQPISQDNSAELKVKLESANSECAKLIQAAKLEAGEIKKKAHEEGLALGQQEGKTEYSEKCAEVMNTLAEAIKQKNLIIREAEGGILQLATKIAGQIIRSEISLNQAVCLNIIAEAINKVTDRDQVIVKVSSTDLELVKRNRDRLSSLIDGVKSFSIVEDTQVEVGGCIVETNLGYIDARIHTRLEAVEAAILKVHTLDKKSPDEAP